MKNVKFFLISWLCIHMCLVFPLQSQAEEQIEPDQKINKVNVQEENKESQEPSEQVETKQDEEKPKEIELKEVEPKEVVNEQLSERKIETDQGIITVNKPEIKVGEEVRITVEPNGKNIQSMRGILQLQKNGEQYAQERMLSFEYDEETKSWIANYKAGIFDLQGDWNLQLIQSYKENEKEDPIENKVKVPLIRIKNETPTIDKELPKIQKVTIDEAKEKLIERKQGDSVQVRVKASDAESLVKEVRVILKGKGNKELSFLLDYNKRDMDWQKIFEITEVLPAGPYELLVEIIDAAGNKLVEESEYTISVLALKNEDDKKIEEREKEKEKEKEDKLDNKLENELEDKKENEKQEDSKVENLLPEEKLPVVQIPKQDEIVNRFIKEPLKEKEEITYVIKEPLEDNKEVHKAKDPKEKNNKQVTSKKKEQKEESKDKKEEKSEQGVQASNVFAIMSGLFVLFLVLKGNKEWG
ncbi:transglycosylase [Bacillus cereus]|uniref:transglycosylase n=1 Tax=Bacillus cereus TaxID=1396 RepID=UPI003641DF1F